MSQSFSGVTILDNEITFKDKVIQDAGGILRVGQQTTLGDLKILNADDTNLWETVGTGTGSFANNKYDMNVTSGQYLVRQSKHRFPYFSGKSQRIELTFDNMAPEANLVKRTGYFSSNAVAPYNSDLDGVWLETTDTSIVLKMARMGTSTLSADITTWSNYSNLGIYQTLSNWDNFTVIELKFLWLGGAVMVLSIKTADGFIEAHRFNYSGTATDLFMLSPNQPVRYEIRSTTGAGNYRAICSQVASEGSVDESGKGLTLFNTTGITCNLVGTMYALMGIKKADTYRDTPIQITNIEVANTTVTADSGILLMIINPTLSGSLTYASASRLQVAYATTQTITAGTGRVIGAAQASSQGGATDILSKNFLAWLTSTISNTHDEYVLAYMPVTTNQTVYGIVNLKEY